MHKNRVDLSVDFDFFVREDPMWDFGHAEDGPAAVFMANHIWEVRYQMIDLHRETAPETFADFTPEHLIGRLIRKGLDFDMNVKRRIMIADSHRHAHGFFISSKAPTLVNVDAHHDCWSLTNGVKISCENWLTALRYDRRGSIYHQVYPKWKDPDNDGVPQPYIGHPTRKPSLVRISQWEDWRGVPPGSVVGDIFLCRSPVWVPPHHDPRFKQLAHDLIGFCDEVLEPVTMSERVFPMSAEEADLIRADHQKEIERVMKATRKEGE